MKPFADIHCHPTLHPFAYHNVGSNKKNSLWCDDQPKARERNDAFPGYFQSSMPALARGNVRLVIAALYPLEQPWLDPTIIGTGGITDFIAKNFLVRIPDRYIDKVQSNRFDYFEYLQKEYQFLKKDHGVVNRINGNDWKYMMAGNASQLNHYKDDTETIVVIPSIEGAHSLHSGNARDIDNGTINHTQTLDNIAIVKSWEYPPLFVTMGHHFYNGLNGHARSIPDGITSFLLRQNMGLNDPINTRGEEVIDSLLAINNYEGNERRILIDTKHMSVAARMQYHEKINKYNANKPEESRIPIIMSHAGYGNHDTMADSVVVPDTNPEKYKESRLYNPWSINLTDQEIADISYSRGLIGLNLDQRILTGQWMVDQSKKFSNKQIKDNAEEVVKFWTTQIAFNILGVVESVIDNTSVSEEEKVKVWDTLSIGSDFDGMINPVDAFIVSDEFKDMRTALAKYMPMMGNYSKCSMGLSIDEILDKVMYDNVVNFVMRNYK